MGILVLGVGLSLGGPTGYAINPARDLGPRIAHALLPIPGKRDSDWSYAWIPVVGPIIGGIVGAGTVRGDRVLGQAVQGARSSRSQGSGRVQVRRARRASGIA